MLSWVVGKPMPIRPHPVSENQHGCANRACNPGPRPERGFGFDASLAAKVIVGLVAILTLLSIGFYLAESLRHISTPIRGWTLTADGSRNDGQAGRQAFHEEFLV